MFAPTSASNVVAAVSVPNQPRHSGISMQDLDGKDIDPKLGAAACIFCEEKAESREHLIPAALGGRRSQTKILCAKCNQTFSRLDGHLLHCVGEICRALGIRPDGRKESPPALGRDGRLHRDFQRHRGKLSCRTNEISIHKKGDLTLVTVAGDDEYLGRVRRVLKKLAREHPESQGETGFRPVLVVDLKHRLRYGGSRFLRAVGRIALNHVAAAYPNLARSPSLAPFKQYILSGHHRGPAPVWHDFQTRHPWAQRSVPPFAHLVIITKRADIHRLQAAVVLFSALPFAVDLGPYDGELSETRVFTIDPLSELPEDRTEQKFPGLAAPIRPEQSLVKFELIRAMTFLYRRIDIWQWDTTPGGLVDDINSTRSIPAAIRPPMIAKLLESGRQQILDLLHGVVQSVPDLLGWAEARTDDRRRIRRLIAARRGMPFGVSPRTLRLVDEVRGALAEALSGRLVYRPLTPRNLHSHLGGWQGVEIAIPIVLKMAHLPVEQLSAEEIIRRSVTAWSLNGDLENAVFRHL
jgi:hypothetical protein